MILSKNKREERFKMNIDSLLEQIENILDSGTKITLSKRLRSTPRRYASASRSCAR